MIYCTYRSEIPEDWKQKADEDRNSSNGRDRERNETWSDSTISIERLTKEETVSITVTTNGKLDKMTTCTVAR